METVHRQPGTNRIGLEDNTRSAERASSPQWSVVGYYCYSVVEGRALIYVHKEQELADVERRFPARHYVLVEDKLRIIAAIKAVWGERVTTVFVRQGHYANDPELLARYSPADLSIERIGELAELTVVDEG
jgi:hypothetical protein